MNTTESNKLIAAFIGKQSKDYFINYDDEIEYGWDLPNGNFITEQLKYHSSWDWLMPVVDQIEQTKLPLANGLMVESGWLIFSPIEIELCFNPQLENTPLIRDCIFPVSSSRIYAVYSAALAFIQWYNQQPK